MQDKFTQEEYETLKEKMNGVKDYLPENLLPTIWDSYKAISKSTEMRPCSCGSAGSLWKKAVDTIRQYISENG